MKLHESKKRLYEIIGEKKYHEDYEYFVFECGTCHNLSLAGGFRHEHSQGDLPPDDYPVLYPNEPDFLPPSHTLAGDRPIVPAQVMKVYRTAWPLRITAPNAFANQIRRALEYICQDKGAGEGSLYRQLEDLSSATELPEELVDVAHLVRKIGNLGSHADNNEVSYWDAELLDKLFQSIIQYVYIMPSHTKRMRQRVSV